MKNRDFSFIVNGEQRTTTCAEQRPLLDVLREDFRLTGTKFGCGEGECGACTVLINNLPTRSCITDMSQIEGAQVETIESLAASGDLNPVQQAFIDQQAMQCGYCVPGHIMTAVALARNQRQQPQASREEIVATMSQHICRCCNYSRILAAVEQVLGSQE